MNRVSALLDTNAILYSWLEPDRLSKTAKGIISDPENNLIVTQVSTIEITLKNKIGKLPLPQVPEIYLPSRIQRFQFRYHTIEDSDIFRMRTLEPFHKDPFDWLLISMAVERNIPIITSDEQFLQYPVTVVW